ncbi:MAG: mechanosensitive ion channel domain-containing protein [Microthrixaceae bacterium]
MSASSFGQDVADLLGDNTSVPGRLVTSAAVVLVAVAAARLVGALAARHADDARTRYQVRKVVRYVVATVALIVLAALWRAFAGRVGLVVGFAAAGVAFAMQEVIGAIAGWFNIISGRIFRVGDRIQMGGVRGDVIDVTPLRTKVMEIGTATNADSWVRGRQFTGRVVAISNKATFTEPVFNYSASFDFIWEEISVPIAFDDDWGLAAEILSEEAIRVSATAEAREAIDRMRRRYPVPDAELEPRVFHTATDDYMELSARFVVPVRSARAVKDDLSVAIVERLKAAGIEVASRTQDLRVDLDRPAGGRPGSPGDPGDSG